MRRPTAPNPVFRRLVLCCGLAAAVALVTAPTAMANLIEPVPGRSPNAEHIDTLYRLVLWIAIVIFVGVEACLGYALVRFRARKGAVPAQIHGNTRLEVGWTVGAAVILVILATITFVKLSSIRTPQNSGPGGILLGDGVEYATSNQVLPPNGKSLNILVNGQQYVWRFTYPYGTNPDGLDRPYSYEKLVVPIDTTVTLSINSQDVVHSWWIPALGGKFEAVPGYTNYTWFKITKPGVYRGQCAFLCGRGHARMIAEVDAVTPSQFEAWIAQQKANLAGADTAAQAARTKLGSQIGAGAVENP